MLYNIVSTGCFMAHAPFRRALLIVCCVGLFVAVLAPRARAVGGPAFLVKDINTEPVEQRMINPSNLLAIGNTVYFVGETWETGCELWKTDGTEAGTLQVRDINPSSGNAFDRNSPRPQFTNVNGTLFFIADDGVHGAELWKSDGTAAGTVLVKDIFSGPSYDFLFFSFTAADGMLFFVVERGINWQLWKSDGTDAGTIPVRDIAGADLTNVNGMLFFVTYDGSSGTLWKSNGTSAGTVIVKQFRSTATFQAPSNLTNVGGTLFFAADDGQRGVELWKSDGTATGTVRVKDINPGVASAFTSDSAAKLTNVGGTLFFAADDGQSGVELWKSDGTPAGTVRLTDIAPGPASARTKALVDVGGTLFFVAEEGGGVERLWKSDGTAAGTLEVTDSVFSPSNLINANGTLFFSGNDVVNGVELWKSDGTAAGTVLVKNLSLGAQSSWPRELTNVNGRVFFLAGYYPGDQELWVSDGTASSTMAIHYVRHGTASASPSWLTDVNGTLFFAANGADDSDGLWKSDGTADGSVIVKLGGCLEPTWLTHFNGMLFFACGTALMKSDGTAAGTVLVKETATSGNNIQIGALRNVSGTLFFVADNGNGDRRFWKSDGTTAGTVPIGEINAAITGSVREFVDVDGELFFTTAVQSGMILWQSDGTASGTVLLKSFLYAPIKYPPPSIVHLANVDGTLFFSAYDSSGFELWKSGGTPAGTIRVEDVNPGQGGSDPSDLVAVNGTLFFSADDGSHGHELWKSDGTAAGTIRVGAGGTRPFSLASVGGTLFFAGNDGNSGYEVWRSDGTATGTSLLVDIAPGSLGSNPAEFTLAGGYLFFSADDGVHGRELWAIRAGVDTYVQAPVWAGAPPAGMASIPVQWGNLGLTGASVLTLTATLDSALHYAGDSSGVTPTLVSNTLTWRLPAAGFATRTDFALWVRAPDAALGTTYPVTLTLAAGGETHPVDNTTRVNVMIARQLYLPAVGR